GRIEVHIVTDPQYRFDSSDLEERIEATRLLRRNPLHIESVLDTALQIGAQDASVLGPSSHFETAAMDPVQWLPGLVCEVRDLLGGELEELDHEAALAQAVHHARRARRSLGPDIVLVNNDD